MIVSSLTSSNVIWGWFPFALLSICLLFHLYNLLQLVTVSVNRSYLVVHLLTLATYFLNYDRNKASSFSQYIYNWRCVLYMYSELRTFPNFQMWFNSETMTIKFFDYVFFLQLNLILRRSFYNFPNTRGLFQKCADCLNCVVRVGFRRIRSESLGSYRSAGKNAVFRLQISSFVDKLHDFK